MPTLDWLNREDAFRIAARVSTRVLRPHAAALSSVGDAAAARDNLLVQGDNLEALAALLPFYRGRVKCIFIDPPYNTKSAFEHYDDNLEHSQWLTMMLPRLQLLREFLREDGSIWVTIDDNEGHYLKVMMDEVFGRGNFVANAVWQKKYTVANDAKWLASDGERQRLRVVGAVGETLAAQLIAAHKGKQREHMAEQIERHNALVAAASAPVNRGERFAPVPRLAYRRDGAQGELALLEREAVFEQVELNLLAEPVNLPGFSMVEQAAVWEVYLEGAKVRVGAAAGEQMGLAGVRGPATEDDLARWLAATLQHPARNVAADIVPSHLRAFIVATLRHLIHEQRLALEQLVRHQHALAQRLEARIAELRDRAAHAAFRQCVLDQGWHVEASAQHRFEFGPAYPVAANRRYDGKFRFTKHYYPVLASLKDKGEEWYCAVAIDLHPQVARWVRNLDSDPVAGFWLPTSFGRFYPDFVCELKDGRLLVVEYKGAHLATVPKEIEKGEVGKLWAERSGGRCLFAMVFKERDGLGVAQQLDTAVSVRR